MKRRVLSLIIALALCLNLCPIRALAAGEGTDGGLCLHHPLHTDECGYVPDNPDAPCTFVCRICPVEDLIGQLPDSVSENNREQVQLQLGEIGALYDGLTADEQQQVDLSLCISLQEQLDGISLAALSDGLDGISLDGGYNMTDNVSDSEPYFISKLVRISTNGYTLTITNSPAIQVNGTGKLYLTGKVSSETGIGVEVLSGGYLSITGADTVISGRTCALNIASGAEVHLSGGTYSGRQAAIQTAGNNFAALLETGYAYFDGSGKLLLPAEAANAKIIVIGQCPGHSGKTYTRTPGATTHAWDCPHCGAGETEACTFTFDQDGNGTCGLCRNTVSVAVNKDDLTNLVYDGTMKPENVEVTVTLTDGTKLVRDTDFNVNIEKITNAGQATVTVTGITFNGTFTKTYTVAQDKPVLSWAKSGPVTVNYDGAPVEAGDLPDVNIHIQSQVDDLQGYLQYSYKKQGDTNYTGGLPKDAGIYEVTVSLPVLPNFEGAVSDPITLTINQINPIDTAPIAKTLTYNRSPQALVTAGTLNPAAVADGLTIEFAAEENGVYSTEIPSETNAGDYPVWYRVVGLTDNYIAPNPNPVKIDGVEILRKKITPVVTLSDYTYLYDGGYKQPTVTVKDEDHVTVLLDTEYAVAYTNNKDVGTAKVTVTDKPGGNYQLTEVEVEFQITSRTQETLSITQKPNTITYGDQFTLSTDGGSGSGDVTWKITSGADVATVDRNSGQVTVTGHGSATVQATKSGLDPVPTTRAADGANYEDATASWTFTAVKKPVTATVTAEDKSYDGNDTAAIHAVVEQGVLPGDQIEFNGLTGTFSDENAGVGKTVNVTVGADGKPVDTSGLLVTITGKNSEHYDVSYSSLTVKATIHKAVAYITTVSDAKNLIYNGAAQDLITGAAAVDPSSVQVEYALSEDGPYSTGFPKGTNAGKYTVWYRVQETGNYTGLAPDSVEVEIGKKPVTPTITLSGDGLQTDTTATPPTYSYIYDGTAKTPDVALSEADGTPIPADQYTVEYSGNVNVGTATVTVTAKADGNYSFTPVTVQFTINQEQAKVVTAPEAAGDPLTFNTRAQKLVTAGSGSGGTMVYRVGDTGNFESTIPARTDAGDYKVYYKVEGDSNHSDSDVGSVTVTIAPKTVKGPTIELELLDDDGNPLVNYTYDGTPKTPTVKVLDGSTEITDTEYNLVYEDNIDAGKGMVSITDKPGGNYTVTGSATFVIVKANIVFNPAPSAASIVYDGKAHELLTPGTTSGGEVLYALNSPTSTYNAAIPQATLAGNYTVYYKVTGDKNHNDLAVQSVPVTIQRKPLTAITIELSPKSFEYDGTVKLPQVTVKDGKTVLPEEEYEWSCDDTSPTTVGEYTITISDAAGGNYDLTGLVSPSNEATFKIGQIAQKELVIGGKPAATNYGDTFKLSVSGGSGTGAVTWDAAGPATVGIDGTVTITGVGEVTITVEQAADANYFSAQTQWTFTAAPKPVTASVVVNNKVYNGNTTATVASASITAINSDTVTIDPASIIAAFDTPSVDTGKTVTLDASNVEVTGDGADKYEISYPATVTAEITQATTTITTNPEGITPLTYNGRPQALVTAGETNVGFLVYSLDGTNFSPEIPTGTNASTYSIYYKVDETDDYTGVAVNATPISVTIRPKGINPVIELLEKSYLYDGTKKDPKITVKDDKTVIDEEQYKITWAGTKSQTPAEMLTVADTYTATIENVTGGNYTFSKTVTVEIVAAEQDALHITGEPSHVYYGDTVTTLGTTGGSGNGEVTWSITAGNINSAIDSKTGRLVVKDTGSITVEAKRTVANYGTVSDTWTFTVEPKPVTAEVAIAPKDYDGTTDIANSAITAAVKAGDLVDSGDNFTIETKGLTAVYDDENVGTNKTVTLSGNMTTTADTAKYTVSCPDTATADITPRQVTVTVTLSDHDLKTENGTYYYLFDGAEKKPAVTVTADDDNATLAASDYTVSYANNKNAGNTAAVTVKNAAGGNYTFDDKTVNFEIRNSAAVLTSTPQAKNLTYNGTAQDLVTVGAATGGTVVYSLSQINPNDENTYSGTIPQGQNAGTYTVYYMVKGDANHDDTAPGQVAVTIKPKEIVSPKVTVAGTYTYNGRPQEPTDTAITVEDGTTPIPASEYTVTFRDNVEAGTATVVITNANGGDYIVNGTGTFTIGKADAAVETDPAGKTDLPYNGAAQELVTAGSASGGTMVYSLDQNGEYSPAIPTAAAVGNYTVYYKVQGDGNHEDSEAQSVSASIIVNTVTNLTVQVTPELVTFNGKKQEPTVTVIDSGSGLVIDGSEYTVTYQDAGGNATTDLTNTGTYTLAIKGTGTHYTFTATATFEILEAGQTPLAINGKREHVYYGDTFQLSTEGGNGTIAWDVGDSTIATITNGLLTITGVGSVTVEATSSAPGYADQTATWSFYAEKKPVTAVVTAAAKTYDGNKTAIVTAMLQQSDLVGSDNLSIKLSGSFEDPSAGTDKKVTVDSSNPDFTGSTGNHENYKITYPATTTASILKAPVTDVTAPTFVTGPLEYTGLPQTLVTAGSSTQGTLEYSTDNITYSASLPTGTGADDYDVWYRVKGDGNHNDTAGKKLDNKVTIAQQTVTSPTIELTPNGISYDGGVHKPSVTVKDNHGRVIPDSEYTVAYDPSGNWKDVGKYTVTIEDVTGGNYNITQTNAQFEILIMGQSPLSITNQPGRVQYGDTFTLSTTGGSGTGTVSWSITGNGVAQIDQNGLVKVLKSGSATVTATKESDNNYGATTATWTFSVEKRPATAIVTADDKPFDGNTSATIHIAWKDGDLLSADIDTINLDGVLTGKFNSADAGTGKTVTITGAVPDNDKYAVTYNTTTTASITPKAATVTGVTANPSLTYTGQPQALVTAGTVDSGNVMYSLDGGATYSLDVPKAANAGTYTVWYKAVSSGNYVDSAPASVSVTIDPKQVSDPVIDLSPESFEYDGTAKKPDVVVKDGTIPIPASEYTVSYSNNTQAGTATVTISDASGGNYNITQKTANFTIKAGAASLTGAPQAKNLTYNGFAQELVTDGTAVDGHVEYSLTGNADDYSTSIPKGTNAGTYSVYYKVKGENGASDTAARIEYVTIQPKPVNNPVITTDLEEDTVSYTGSAYRPKVLAVLDGSNRISAAEYSVTYKNNTNVGTATIIVMSKGGSNYDFYATTTFEIIKAAAKFTTEPAAKTGLVYNGTAQELVDPGTADGGIIFYSLDGVTYSGVIPTGTDKKTYTVYAKVVGDSKHADSDVVTISVKIDVNNVANPTVTLSANSFQYTGQEQKPAATVRDDKNNVIPASEYEVTYANNVAVGKASVTVTGTGKNYSFQKTVDFEITAADQPALTITGKPDTVYYGDTVRLGTTGGSGTVTWTVADGADKVDALGNGQFKIKDSGSITVKAEAGGSSDTCTLYADPKPVTAVVTAADKPYDTNTTATLTFTVSSGLASGDVAISGDAAGNFKDANVGTNKTVIITGLTVSDEISKKYDIQYPATTTASITPAAAEVTTAPGKIDNLTYTGLPQTLVTPGAAANGTMAYSLDGVNYSFNVPEGTDAKTYNVWYKAVAADENHKDSAPAKVDNVAIAVNKSTPSSVLCSPNNYQYDGTAKTPAVVVWDNNGHIIPESEYTVTVNNNAPAIAVGNYTVTVTDNPGGNYQFTTSPTGTFEIVAASQNPLTVVNKPAAVYYGDTFRLSATGGSGSGAINWSVEGSAATIISDGTVTVVGTGQFTVKAYREASDGYDDSNTDIVPFDAKPKPVTPVVTAENKLYDRNTTAKVKANWKSGDMVGNDAINLDAVLTGTFDSATVGTNKRVTFIVPDDLSGVNGNYYITWPDSTTASINKVDAKMETEPKADPNLTYTGSAQALVSAGRTVGGIGTIVYSTSQNGVYSEDIPTGTGAGEYTVWYKVADSVNYTGISATEMKVKIAKAEPTISTNPTATGTAGQKLGEIALSDGKASIPGKFAWEHPETVAVAGTAYTVIFTPNDTANYESVTFTLMPVSAASSGDSGASIPDTPSNGDSGTSILDASSTPDSASLQTTVRDGTANTVLSAADGTKLVREAVANQSKNVVIKPEITSDVAKAEVSIPSSTVRQLSSATDAALTVSSPIADVTISNAALDTLSQAGGSVSVAAEKAEQSVVVTLAAGGEIVEQVPGGLTLTVPAEDAGPGTVAVLVHDDGTRETVRKSVVEDGVMSIPLSGSATVEIVDNSKEFADVSPESWEADAVAFASARELFSGTSETTFSPDQAMSRGMLATVLYRLDGSPELDLTEAFQDVSSEAWYAEGVAWAVENGIAGGYGDGQFGPDDSITREQFVVMLWRYAGSPESNSQVLDFADADQVNGYAQKALCWAVEKGIVHGVGNGMLDPGGAATRAQAAQLLKNFMENT